MIRVLILAAGSAGDVYPFIVIGQALRARGHAVTLVASANFQARVEQAGLRFVSGLSQQDLDASVADPGLWHPVKGFATIWKHMARHLPGAYAQQLALLKAEQQQGPTVIVASTLGLTGRLLQETQGVPLATVHLAPSCFLGAHDASVRRGLNWPRSLPQPVIRVIMALVEQLMLDPIVRSAINRLRASLGLAPVRRVMSHWLHSPQRVICAFPAWFAAPQPDWPPNTVCTGFVRMPPSGEQQLAPGLQRFLDAGAAPIVVTPGSAMAHGRHFLSRALDAAGELGLRVVVVTPYREQLPATLPVSVLHVPYAPFDLLSRQAAAFVHHGGIGTSATVLAAGKPQLVVPFAFDQPDNAARLRRLGVAATVLPGAPPRAWRAALAGLLADPAVASACAALAASMGQAVPAEEQIADLVTDLVTELATGMATGAATAPRR